MRYDTSIEIAGRRVAGDTATYFIADIAANHDGDLDRARSLIGLAKQAGADCAKFQHFTAAGIVSDHGFRTLDTGQSHQAGWAKSVYDIYDDYHCRREWTAALIAACRDAEIDFMTTPYDYAAIDAFAPLVPAYKVGSGDISWVAAIERMARTGLPILLACGAADMADVERAVDAVLAHNPALALMQCNTNYTGDLANFRHINLHVLRSFAARWPGMVLGLSDHSPGHATVLGAIALGARIVEKHFTDDNGRTGPDHHFAMTPATWREMVDRSRELEAALGDGIKRVEDNEADTVIVQRRAIRCRTDLPAGTVIAPDHLDMLRPCPADALPPYRIDDVLGRRLEVDKVRGAHLTLADLARRNPA